MAAQAYGLLGSSSSGVRVAIQKDVYDFTAKMAKHPLFKFAEDVPINAWYDHYSGYIAPAALDWGVITGGGGTLPTTGQLYPR